MNSLTSYDDMDQTSTADRIRAAAPAFFVDAMKKYIVRNSIKITTPEFVFYCACTWEAQKHWLNADNMGWAIEYIVSELQFPRLPADPDWLKPAREYLAEKRREEQERLEQEERKLRLAKPNPQPTAEQIARVEKIVADCGMKLAAANKN